MGLCGGRILSCEVIPRKVWRFPIVGEAPFLLGKFSHLTYALLIDLPIKKTHFHSHIKVPVNIAVSKAKLHNICLNFLWVLAMFSFKSFKDSVRFVNSSLDVAIQMGSRVCVQTHTHIYIGTCRYTLKYCICIYIY